MSTSLQDIILYTFLSYLTFHLIIDDILLTIRIFKIINNNLDHLNVNDERTIIKIMDKVCDVVLKSIVGYFDCFKVCWIEICNLLLKCIEGYYSLFGMCWTKSIECLQATMCAYITFLETLCKDILTYPTCIFTCSAGVLIVAILPIVFYLIKN